ncbi:anti-CBASS protein Acb1 family protein [Flintibacter porci]|uniref:anti-CBASS protein Acb1 family protein n=1 Tax=Flintibacter porci TaxID=3342383 RepID=UPI003F8AD4B9
MYYEGNGLFAKIIDTPAEEAIKHGFKLKDISDQKVEDFYTEALDELDWDETAITCLKWARLFGGSLAVMLINDGRGLDEPLDWRNIQSIDDIRVFDRSVIQPDYTTLFNYDPRDPFSTRGSRLGLPEYYQIFSKYGSFTVHDSRCLVFQNGILPENTTNSVYQLWGVPEYIRLNKALRDAEVAHHSAPKMLDRSVQPIYKMQNLAETLATEEGENTVLKRLQVIDMARGLLNSLVIDAEGEDYDFKTFQFSGINDVVSASCNMLSALSNIPQTILFGQSVGGMSSTDDTSMENYYNYIERIQRRMLKSNLRYLLSIIFQAGLATGEVDEIPKLKIEFNPLWSLSDLEQADLEQKREQAKFTRAQTAQIYVNMQAVDPSEVRQKLADSEEFDVEAMLDEYEDDELFPEQIVGDMPVDSQGQPVQAGATGEIAEQGSMAQYAQNVSVEEHNADPESGGNAPAAAPAATKLPQDMSAEELAEKAEKGVNNKDGAGGIINRPKESVGVLVISNGRVLSGTRHNDFGYGLVCGPGGHVEPGETPAQAAFRETEEEFGISPKELIPLGRGPYEPDTGLRPHLFLCTDYEGEPDCLDLEMTGAKFRTLAELDELAASMFQPFADGLKILKTCIDTALFFGDEDGEMFEDLAESVGKVVVGEPEKEDGGPGSGNFGHSGREGQVGGSEERSGNSEPYVGETSHGLPTGVYSAKKAEWSRNASRQLSDDEVKEMVDATADYTRNYKDVVAASARYEGVYASRGSLMDDEEKEDAEKSAEAIEKMISLSDKYEGTAERAMTMDRDTFDRFAQAAATGEPFGLGHLSSWTTEENGLKRVLNSRNSENDPEISNVVLECQSKSGVSIKNMAEVDMDEVLFSKDARFRVTSIDPEFSVGRYGAVKFTLEEVDDNEDGGPGSGNHG